LTTKHAEHGDGADSAHGEGAVAALPPGKRRHGDEHREEAHEDRHRVELHDLLVPATGEGQQDRGGDNQETHPPRRYEPGVDPAEALGEEAVPIATVQGQRLQKPGPRQEGRGGGREQ
jgi:hypothetical protein